ncbi:hypothetical protein [Lentzea jiangxiensis]|uniref:Pyridoxamine 5'-phosphate oxidase n=1 Tax=Lentzea jiangxiensis TaxID=641025 RepID=A0A1H0T264_9PSEU|nr:hypothetical protein [Lentzea jiangxiensis]SDP47861.1 hypothetical protein SAMN05421507_10970 [Lentzea jiangxiensis]
MEITRVLDAALRKAAAVWITSPGREPRLVHAHWRDDALWVISGGTEPEAPLTDGAEVTITVRSPTTHSHLVDVPAVAHLTEPDDETAQALRTARLNTRPEWEAVYRLEFGS